MPKETLPSSPQSKSSLFNQDGSINESILAKRFGLGVEEAQQEVSFGGRNGTVAEMLNDAKCPVGGIIEGAYEEGGIDGVVKQFGLLKMMDPKFEVKVTEQTIEREQKKNSRTQTQVFPTKRL